jgi:hypothetical protein
VNFPNLTQAGDFTHINIQVRHAVISGKVTDDAGAPVAGAAIRVTSGPSYTTEVITDGAGRYRFTGPLGTYGVIPRPLHGYTPGQPGGGAIDANYTPLTVDLHYDRDGELRGVARDDGGQGIAGIMIEAVGPRGAIESATTAADGSYHVAAPTGLILLSPGALAGYETPLSVPPPASPGNPAPAPLVVKPGQLITGDLDSRLNFVYHSAIIHGIVTDSFGTRIAGAVIDAFDRSGLYNKAQSGPDGSYMLRVRTLTTTLIPEPAGPDRRRRTRRGDDDRGRLQPAGPLQRRRPLVPGGRRQRRPQGRLGAARRRQGERDHQRGRTVHGHHRCGWPLRLPRGAGRRPGHRRYGRG